MDSSVTSTSRLPDTAQAVVAPVIVAPPPPVAPVIVAPPPPTVSPVNYAGGALVTGFLAGALATIVPAWSMDQATKIATLIVMVVGMIHMLLQWFISWRWPSAPPLPDVLK